MQRPGGRLGGEDEERVGAVKVLAVLDGAEPVGVAVGEKVLRGGVRHARGPRGV